jgi:hypothetical protein
MQGSDRMPASHEPGDHTDDPIHRHVLIRRIPVCSVPRSRSAHRGDGCRDATERDGDRLSRCHARGRSVGTSDPDNHSVFGPEQGNDRTTQLSSPFAGLRLATASACCREGSGGLAGGRHRMSRTSGTGIDPQDYCTRTTLRGSSVDDRILLRQPTDGRPVRVRPWTSRQRRTHKW